MRIELSKNMYKGVYKTQIGTKNLKDFNLAMLKPWIIMSVLLFVRSIYFLKNVFVGLPHLATYIFLIFSTNEPELGAGFNPGMAFNPFPSSSLDKTRRDSNPQPLDCELSPLTTRPDLCP